MKSLFCSLLVTALVVGVPAEAKDKDLVEGQVIGHFTRNIEIGEVVEARIAKDKVNVYGAGENKGSSAQAIIELTLQVQGNICGANPEEASMSITRLGNGTSRLSLGYLDRENEPYKLILKGCLAYSAPRTVKAVFPVSSSVYKDKPVEQITYEIEGDSSRKVVYTHTLADGIKVTLE